MTIGSRCAASSCTPEREPPLADHPPEAVERDVERLVAIGFEEALGQRLGIGRRGEARIRRSARRAASAAAPAARPAAGAWARISASRSASCGRALEQAVEIHPARQLVDDVAEAVERADRVGPGARPRASGSAASPRTPPAPPASAATGPGPSASRRSGAAPPRPRETHRRQLGAQDVGVVGQPLVAVRRPARRTALRPPRHAARSVVEQRGAIRRGRRAPRRVERARRSAGRRCSCRSSIIWMRCSAVRSAR